MLSYMILPPLAQILGVSVDSPFSHLAWVQTGEPAVHYSASVKLVSLTCPSQQPGLLVLIDTRVYCTVDLLHCISHIQMQRLEIFILAAYASSTFCL